MISMAGFEDPELRKLKERERLAAQANAEPALLQTAMEKPKTPFENLRDNHGTGGAIMRIIGTGLSGGLLGDVLTPETSGPAQAEYKESLSNYKAYQASQMEQQIAAQASQTERDRISVLGTGLRDAFATETPDDDLEAVMAARAGGMDLADIKHYQSMAGNSYKDPKYETKFSNGQLVRYDVNNPDDVVVMKDHNGNPIAEKADADIRKTAGWFRRAVPALENMHKLEDRGVTLPREALLLTQQAQDADGFFDKQVYDRLLNNLALTQDQKQYLRNAQDLAMIQLRKESGAAIGVQEMFNELNQNVMLSDMGDEGYEYQRRQRGNKYRQLSAEMPEWLTTKFANEGLYKTLDRLRSNSGRVRPDAGGLTASEDPVGEFFDFSGVSDAAFEPLYEAMTPGTKFVGPDGKTYVKGEVKR